MTLPYDETLAPHGAKRLLDLYFAARHGGRNINSKGARTDRKAWLRAEKAAETELKKLVASCAEAPAEAGDPPDIAGREQAALGTAFGLTREKLEAQGIDAAALEEKLEALDASLRYSDRDADETSVPSQGERIFELAERAKKARAEERRKKKNPPPVRSDAESIRSYSPRETFVVGEWLAHGKFGEGQVIEGGSRLRVRFQDAERQLVHVPPPQAEFKPIEVSAPRPRSSALPAHNVPVRRVAPDPRLTEDQEGAAFVDRAKPPEVEPDAVAEPAGPAPDET